MQSRQNLLDHVAIRVAIAAPCSDVLVEVRTDEGAVHNRIDERYPLFRQRRRNRRRRKYLRPCEYPIEICRDCLGFEQADIAVAQSRHFTERVNLKQLRSE